MEIMELWGLEITLVREIHSRDIPVRKTAIQKVPYLLQEVCGFGMDLRFVMYHYGPYSFELAHAIETLNATGIIDVKRDETGYGYLISISDEEIADKISKQAEPFLKKGRKKIQEIIDYVADLDVQSLELLTSTHFAKKLLREKGLPEDNDTIVSTMGILKPHFSKSKVLQAVDDLDTLDSKLNK